MNYLDLTSDNPFTIGLAIAMGLALVFVIFLRRDK